MICYPELQSEHLISIKRTTVPVNKKFTFQFHCTIVAQCEHLRSVLHTTLGKRNGTECKTIPSGIADFTRGPYLWKAFLKLSEVFFNSFFKPFFELSCCPIWS